MKYKNSYYVVYWFTQKDGKQGFGNIIINLKLKIKRYSDIGLIIDYIKSEAGYVDVLILNWKKIK